MADETNYQITLRGKNITADAFKQVQGAMRELGVEVDHLKTKTSSTSGSFGTLKGAVTSLAGAAGIGLGIGAAVSFGKALLDDADALLRMHDQTGVTLQGLQRFQIAGDDAGNSIDQITGAITKMEDLIAGGNKGALDALERLGISFQDIKNLSPENQFIEISDAIRRIQSPQEQVNIALDLFGKGGAAILPTLKRGFDDVKGAAVGMSDETIRALDEAGDMMASFWRTSKGLAAEALVGTVRYIQDGIDPMTHGLRQAAREAVALQAELERMGNAIKPGAKALPGKLQVPGADSADVTRWLKEQEEAWKKQERIVTEAAKNEKQAFDKLGESVRAFRAEGVNGAAAVALGFAGGLNVLRTLGVQMGTITSQFKNLADNIPQIDLTKAFGLLPKVLDAGVFPQFLLKMPAVGKTAGEKFSSGFAEAAQTIPGTLARAFEGGGGIVGAAASLGTQFGSMLGEKIGKKIGSLAGMSGPIGAAIGSLAGPILGWIAGMFGPSQKELDARKVVADFEKGFASTTDMLQKVTKAYATKGLTAEQARRDVEAMWAAEKQGAQATQVFVDRFNAALGEQSRHIQNVRNAVSELNLGFDEMGPTLARQLLSEQAETMAQKFRDLEKAGVPIATITGKMAEQINAFVDSAMDAGVDVPASMQEIVRQLANQGLMTEENIARWQEWQAKQEEAAREGAEHTEAGAEKGADAVETGVDRMKDAMNGLPDTARHVADRISDYLGNLRYTIHIDYDESGRPSGSGAAASAAAFTGRPSFQPALGTTRRTVSGGTVGGDRFRQLETAMARMATSMATLPADLARGMRDAKLLA